MRIVRSVFLVLFLLTTSLFGIENFEPEFIRDAIGWAPAEPAPEPAPVRTAKFEVGQVVAVVMPTAVVQYFKIGYIDAKVVEGLTVHYYTDADKKVGIEWPEESLRALTKKECGQ